MRILSVRPVGTPDLTPLAATGISVQARRDARAPLLAAFDVYKQNVLYGIIDETSKQHEEVIAWYHDLCDLKDSALTAPPAGIRKYVKGEENA